MGKKIMVKLHLDTGFPSAKHHSEVAIDEDEISGKTEAEIDEYIIETYLNDFTWNHINAWWEFAKDDD